MRHTKTLCTLVLGAVVVSGCADDATSPTSLAPTESLASLSAGTTSSDNQLVVFKKSRIPNGFAAQVAALGGNVELTISTAGAAVISGVDAAGLDAIRASSDVDMVEPEIMLELPEPFEVGVATAADAAPASPGDPSAAYFFPRQWNMRAIGADVAWAAGNTGSSDVTVAILDTGIGYTHEDLVGRVDLSRSVSFVPDDDFYVAYYFPGAHPIADIGYHGTHVAATVASNGLVAAGVTSQTTLMGVKVCSVVTGGCAGSAIFAGIEYAVDNGADVINMSLGGAFQKKDYPGYVSVLNRLFNYAHQNKVTVVVSAGNESADLDHNYYPDDDDVQTHYPSLYKTYCSTPNNICVSATGPTAAASNIGPWTNVDAPAVYTNYGRSAVNVAAPGGNTGAGVMAACSTFSLVIPVCQANGYAVTLSGTSMAAPHVTGLAALMVAQYGKNPAKVRAAIQQSADDLGQPGTDPFYGKGRINVARATGN